MVRKWKWPTLGKFFPVLMTVSCCAGLEQWRAHTSNSVAHLTYKQTSKRSAG